MCGLVSLIQTKPNGFDAPLKNSLWPMMLLNSLRGPHSTGLAGIEIQGKQTRVDVVKRAGSPYSLLLTAEARRFMANVFNKYLAVMAHGRWATRGAITSANAHPFMTRNITLIHNGGISNLWKFDVEGENRTVQAFFDVDSAGVAYLMETLGVEETLQAIEGAFAFIWHDRRTGQLHAVRNTERPLWIAKRTKPDVAYALASDPLVIQQATDRFNVEFEDIVEVPPQRMLSFPLGDSNLEPTDTPVKFFTPKVYQRGNPQPNLWAPYERSTTARSGPAPSGPLIYPLKDLGVGEKPRMTGTDVRSDAITVDGYRFAVGEPICFYPGDLQPIGQITNELAGNRFFISGMTTDTEKVLTAIWIKGTPLYLKDEGVLAGRIMKIRTAPDAGDDRYRLILGDLRLPPEEVIAEAYKPAPADYRWLLEKFYTASDAPGKVIPEKSAIIALPDRLGREVARGTGLEDIVVTLKDGKQMSVVEFENIAKLGCLTCTRDVYLPDAPGCIEKIDPLQKGKPHERRFSCPHCTGTHILAH